MLIAANIPTVEIWDTTETPIDVRVDVGFEILERESTC